MTDNFCNPARMTAEERQLAANPQSLTQQLWNAPQPITHAAILAAVETLPHGLDGNAAIADALCNALGVEVPAKRAPWEVAYEAWWAANDAGCPERVWQAAVEWCVEQINGQRYGATNPTHYNKGWNDAIDAACLGIIGQEQQP
jgi:hypothetical protein